MAAGRQVRAADAELRRTATAAFEDHQIAVVKRGRAHPHQDLPKPGAWVLVRSQHDAVNTAEAVDAIGFHLILPLIPSGSLSLGASPLLGARCEFSELSHIESLWEFSLNSQASSGRGRSGSTFLALANVAIATVVRRPLRRCSAAGSLRRN